MNKILTIVLLLGASSAQAYYTDEPMTRDEFNMEMDRRENEANHDKDMNDFLNKVKGKVYQ